MILPNLRASFGRTEVRFLLDLLSTGDGASLGRETARLEEEGLDAILDDPRTLSALLSKSGPSAAPVPLVFYLLVRHALLEDGIGDRALADYIAALLVEFGRGGRAHSVHDGDERRYNYLVEIVEALETATGREAFLLRAHLGNFSLWVSGLFPDHIIARVHRRGAPGLEYYEALGAAGYRMAAESRDAGDFGMDRLYQACSENFPALRIALNRVSDRHLFPSAGNPVDRLLRQVVDRLRAEPSGPFP